MVTWCNKVAGSLVVIFAVTFIVILPLLCRRWPHSPYFSGNKRNDMRVIQRVVRENDRRNDAAAAYLQALRHQSMSSIRSPSSTSSITAGTSKVSPAPFMTSSAQGQSVPARSKSADDSPEDRFDLVVGIVTMNRDNVRTDAVLMQDPTKKKKAAEVPSMQLGYLTQTVAGVLQAVAVHRNRRSSSVSLFQRIKVFVCNVDQHPQRYDEAAALDDVIHVVTRYRNATVMRQSHAFAAQDLFEREKDDYAYCLEQAASMSTSGRVDDGVVRRPRYVMLVEDDVVLQLDALDVLDKVLRRRSLDGEGSSLSDTENRWLFVKLYYPEKWLGYGNDLNTVIELTCVSVIAATLTVVALRRPDGSSRPSSFGSFLPTSGLGGRGFQTTVLAAVAALFAVGICLGMGRPHVRAWRRQFVGVHRTVPSPDCCTQAVLYPGVAVTDLLDHLDGQRCTIDYSIDIAIAGYARLRRFQNYLIDPNVAKHIGMVSSVRQYGKQVADFLE